MAWSIDDRWSQRITTGIATETEARRIALMEANKRAESVWLYSGADASEEIKPTDPAQGADECAECGTRFDATPRDKRPICPRCR